MENHRETKCEDNCTLCTNFCSYRTMYDGDELEPDDCGRCDEDYNCDAGIEYTCDLFTSRNTNS